MRANDLNTLSLPGEQAKGTTLTVPDRARLLAYLRGLPSLAFSYKGRATICQRFGVGDDELAAAVAALLAHPSRPTPELLRTIGTAVGRGHHATEGAGQC